MSERSLKEAVIDDDSNLVCPECHEMILMVSEEIRSFYVNKREPTKIKVTSAEIGDTEYRCMCEKWMDDDDRVDF